MASFYAVLFCSVLYGRVNNEEGTAKEMVHVLAAVIYSLALMDHGMRVTSLAFKRQEIFQSSGICHQALGKEKYI